MAIKEIAPHSIPTTEKNEGYKKPLDIQFVNNSIPENEEKNNTYNNISNKNYKPFISNNSINKIKNEVNIVDICRNYGIKVEKGKALCPFHDEKTPSMSVNYKNTNRYHCFGCGESGDVINFVMKMENLDFLSATEKIANDFGIFLEYENLTEEQIKNIEIERKIYKRYEELQEFYTESLFSEEGRQALEYLRSRGLSENIIKEYGVGYAPKYIKEKINEIFKGINKENLVEYKIIKEWKKEDGEVVYFPLLQNRITFPLTKNNEIIGFQGRAIDLDEKIRYLTATKELFIWNIDVIKKNKEINLTEGIIDALTLIQADKENTIALLGTQAITKNTEKIFKNTEKINFWLDDDNAGKEAEEKYSKIFGNKTTIIPLKFKDSIKTKLSKGEEGYELEKATVEGFIENNKKDLNGIFQLYLLKNENNFEKAIQEYKNFLNNCEKNSYTILEKKYEEFLQLNDIEKAKQTKEFIKFIYEFNQGNTDIINVFRDKLKKDAKINFGRFDEIIEEIEEIEEELENNTTLEWELIDGILYKNIFDTRIGTFRQIEVTITIPEIKNVLTNNKTGEEELQITFIDRFGIEKEVIAPRSKFLIKNDIIKTLGGVGFDISEENALDLIKYFRYLENDNIEDIELKKVTNVTGYYNTKTYIGRKGEIITAKGIQKDSDIVYHNNSMDRTLKEITEINMNEWKKLIKLTFPEILKLNEKKVSLAIVSWFLSSVCKEPLQKVYKQNAFPILNIFGVRGTGKTTIATLMQKMLGGKDSLPTAKITYFSLINSLSMSNAYPFVLDEYKIGDLGKNKNSQLLNVFKLVYNSSSDLRGNADKTVTEYNLTSPVCVIGENSFSGDSSDAVKDRSAIVSLSRAWLDKNKLITGKMIRKLNSINLEEFLGGYLVFILQLLETGEFTEMYKTAEERAFDFADEYKDLLSSRHILTLSVLSFGVEMLKKLYNVAEIEFNITNNEINEMFEHALNHALNIDDIETSLDRVMQYTATTLIKEFDDDEILADYEENRLYINGGKLLTLLETHRYQGKVDVPEKSGIRQYIDESINSDGYVVDKNKQKKINDKNNRCFIFDMEKLEAIAKIDKSTWKNWSNNLSIEGI